jgi:hypothetical protein
MPLAPGVEAAAQVNTEVLRDLSVDEWRASVGGDLALEAGNVDLVEVGAHARFDVRREAAYAFFVGQVRYGVQNETTFKNRSFAHARLSRDLGACPAGVCLVGEAFAQLQHDAFTLLQLRTLVGAGLRARLAHRPALGVYLGLTPMLEIENLDAARVERHPAHLTTARGSSYLSLHLAVTDLVTLRQTLYVQPRLDAPGDLRVLEQARLEVQLTRALALVTSLNVHVDRRPPDGVEPLDLALRNGLRITLSPPPDDE